MAGSSGGRCSCTEHTNRAVLTDGTHGHLDLGPYDRVIAALHPDATVTEAGPRSLWSRFEEAYRVFTEHGGPGPERYGLTVDHEGQHVRLDGPGGPCWRLRP
ncbi:MULTISPECIES: hypothetical protein [Streptomyces]|uniref:hypothetical protein n=1 Tax=Streptomyces TaxID=1883 RepID=UPI001F10EA46|nr:MULTISPECIES: hypothetical protein [Streptomyces]